MDQFVNDLCALLVLVAAEWQLSRHRHDDDRVLFHEQLPSADHAQPLLESREHLITVQQRRVSDVTLEIVAALVISILAYRGCQDAPLFVDNEAMPDIGRLAEPRRHDFFYYITCCSQRMSGRSDCGRDVWVSVTKRVGYKCDAARPFEW